MPRASRLLPLLAVTSCVTGPANPNEPTPARVELAAPASDARYAHAVFYELFVRSFQDSNGDGKGDLPGLISRLDYLNDGDPRTTTDLGVDALWLMPVFASPSYHGYDVTDYERINPDYGTNEDLERLCAEAHRRGMRVIVDLVINHSSSQHPWFIDSASSPDSARRDWYVWSDRDLGWKQPFDTPTPGPTARPRRRLLLRRLLERHAGPQPAHARGARGDQAHRLLLARQGGGWLPAGRRAPPDRNG
ncbi:alpha-amylase family glycosyl hydrolase [Cystobacter fuscus]